MDAKPLPPSNGQPAGENTLREADMAPGPGSQPDSQIWPIRAQGSAETGVRRTALSRRSRHFAERAPGYDPRSPPVIASRSGSALRAPLSVCQEAVGIAQNAQYVAQPGTA